MGLLMALRVFKSNNSRAGLTQLTWSAVLVERDDKLYGIWLKSTLFFFTARNQTEYLVLRGNEIRHLAA
jgi:hypothetical protein